MRTALRDLEDGRLIGALTGLQSVLDLDDDVFVRFPSEPVPCGAHAFASRVLGTLSARARASYETLYGKQARQLLETALCRPDPELLARVVRRFYYTVSGFEAGNRLADYWSDHGCDELAWGWWRRVREEPVHRSRIENGHRLRAAWCCQRLGRLAEAGDILKELSGNAVVTIAGRPLSSEKNGERLPQQAGTSAGEADTCVVAGGIDRNATGSGTPPAVGRLVWRTTLAGELSRHIESLARAWESYQLQGGLPVGTAQSPLLVGEMLIFRDFESLRAVDVRSGRGLWFYPCESSLSREISPRQTIPADGDPDPNKSMRCLVANCLLGTLASDARRVFAIDRIEADEPPPGNASTQSGDAAGAPLRQTNLLVAIDLARRGDGIKPQWTVGGRAVAAGESRTLAGHFFLGPPLPVDDRLFAVSECNELLYLSCLRSADGSLLWSQVLCSVPQPIGADHQRSGLICSPACGGGIVVCPTQAGVLVAVDALSGRLLWAATHDEGDAQHRQQISAWPYGARRRIGHAGYLNLPVIHRGRVIYLPAHSDHVQCLDLATGRTRWRARRDDLESTTATEYVAAVTSESVLVVGRRRCRGLSLDSGAEKWMVRLGSAPAGRGVRLGQSYQVPLDDGGLVSLDVDSGRRTAAPPVAGTPRLGNLVAGRDLIVSMGTSDIAVYRQSGAVLRDLESEPESGTPAPSKMLEIAELQLLLGNSDGAEQILEKFLLQSGDASEAARAAGLLCDLLLGRLADAKLPAARDRVQAALGRLATLSGEPGRRGRYLWERFRISNARGDSADALAAARELAAGIDVPLAAGDDPSRTAAPHVLAAGLLKQLPRGEAADVREVEVQIAGDLAAARAARDVAALRRCILLSGESASAGDARLELARLLVGQGALQQAELALLACRECPRDATAGEATRLLAELWNRQGLYHDAALLLAEIGSRFADVEVAAQLPGRKWLEAFPRDTPAFDAYRRLAPPAWAAGGVRIVENRAANDALQSIYNGNGVQFLPTPRQSPFDLFDRGRSGGGGEFSVVDRHTGQEYPETIRVAGRFSYPVNSQSGYLQHSHVGHFFPLGGTGALHGVSLLERRLLWTTVPPGLAGVKEIARVGPAGPRFCSFQHRQHLFVVDPADGGVLWHRDDLETSGGLNDPFQGIIGDDRVLVVFASNGANYIVYDTASGTELRRGKLDIQPTRLPRRAIGRRLLHGTLEGENRRLRVWDPATDRFLWDEPADQIADVSVHEGVPPGTKVLAFVRDTDEAAFVTGAGRIRVVDLATGRERLDVALDPGQLENLSFLRAFRDHERYYFNLQRAWPPRKPSPVSENAVIDAALPRVDIQGELCAVEIATGRLLWQRTFGSRSLVQMPDLPLPVLVSVCRLRKQDQSSLAVEVLDVRTGETIASRDDVLSDRLLQALYDRKAGLIELRGAKTAIRVEFPASVARLDASEPPR